MAPPPCSWGSGLSKVLQGTPGYSGVLRGTPGTQVVLGNSGGLLKPPVPLHELGVVPCHQDEEVLEAHLLLGMQADVQHAT